MEPHWKWCELLLLNKPKSVAKEEEFNIKLDPSCLKLPSWLLQSGAWLFLITGSKDFIDRGDSINKEGFRVALNCGTTFTEWVIRRLYNWTFLNNFCYFSHKTALFWRSFTCGMLPILFSFHNDRITRIGGVRDRLRTLAAGLVLYLHLGVDPPDVWKPSPCARWECWVDPVTGNPIRKVGNVEEATNDESDGKKEREYSRVQS